MKILLLNPHRDAMQEVVELFRNHGLAVLMPMDTEDAWQMLQLHGTSVDLAIIHREWGKKSGQDLGLRFVERFRADAVQGDLPYILTTEAWNEGDCAHHQQNAGPLGANAYLTWPFPAQQLFELVRQVIPETSTSIARLPKGGASASAPSLAKPGNPEAFNFPEAPASLPSFAAPVLAPPPAAAGPDLSAIPGNASTFELNSEPAFELNSPNSEAATGFTGLGTHEGLVVPPSSSSLEFTNGMRTSSPLAVPTSFELPSTEAPSNFSSPLVASPAVPPPFRGPKAPAAAPDDGPLLFNPVSGPMVLEDAPSSLGNLGEESDPSVINLVAPDPAEFSKFLTPVVAMPAMGENTSATIAIGSGVELPPPSVNEGTQHLSAIHSGTPAPVEGGTVTMMAPPELRPSPVQNLGKDDFDQGVSFELSPEQSSGAGAPNPQAAVDLDSDKEVLEKMPYLFSGAEESEETSPKASALEALGSRILPAMTGILKAPPPSTHKAPMQLDQSMGDAIVPGGAAQSPDADTLKKYLMLREQDVAVLSTQLKTIQDQLAATTDQVRAERARSGELSHLVTEQAKRIEDFEREKSAALESMQAEIDDLRFQLKARTDKLKLVENRLREGSEETERLKERVRSDIRKIRVHEKELENRLEILKKDSEALIAARETKIIELKRKVDLLEFNMDLLQNQYAREKEVSAKLRERLAKAAQIVRVAGGLLDSEGKAALEQLTSIDKSENKEDKREAS